MNKAPIILFLVGLVILVVTSILGWLVIPGIIEDKVKEEVRLINGSDTWNKWQSIPAPIYLKFYIFHVANPDEVDRGAKPILEEKGPYVYRETREKFDIQEFPDEDMVSYRQNITYFFEPESSIGNDTDRYDIVNIPYICVAAIAKLRFGSSITNLVMQMVETASKGGERLVKRQVAVHEMIFDGWDVSVYSKPFKAIFQLFPALSFELPYEFSLELNRFAIYLTKNASDDGLYKIFSGVKDPSNFGEIYSINGKHELDYWADSEGNACNQINGSDASIFPPFLKKDRILRGYSPDVCRSMYGVFGEEIEVEGIPGYRFINSPEILEQPSVNGDNLCFCPECNGNTSYSLPSGATRMQSCKKGAPIVLTLPHFLDGDEWLGSNSVGMQPDHDKHFTYMDIEPNTGVPLRLCKRIQINTEIRRWPEIAGFENFRDMVFPAAWVEEYAHLDDGNIEEIKSRFLTPMKIIKIGKWSLLGVGALIAAAGVVLFMVRRK